MNVSCKENIHLVTYLKITTKIQENVEVAEHFSEEIEKLVINNTKCFIDGFDLLDAKEKESIALRLKKPIFVERKHIQKKLKKFSNYKESGLILIKD